MKRFGDGIRLFLGLAAAALVLPACGSSGSSGGAGSAGVLQFLSAAVQIEEDDLLGSVTLTVTRTGGTAGAVTVDWATAVGTAGAADFTGANSTLTWLAGETDKSFTVNITADAIPEGSEFFSVTLSNATGGATLGAIATSTVELLDTIDAPVSGVLQFSAATYPTAEGVDVVVTVTRTGGTTDEITVDVGTTGGTATVTADYTDPGFPVTLTWPAGNNTPQIVTIPIVNDGPLPDALAVETILLALSNEQNVTTPGTPPVRGTIQTATVEITDDDTAGVIEFTAATFSIAENASPGIIKVTRLGGTQGAASVQVSVTGGTATTPADHTFVTFQVDWADGVGGEVDVIVPVVDDPDTLGDVTLVFGLATPTGAVLGGLTSTTLTITDDETIPPVGEITVSVSPNPVFESLGPVTIVLTRQNGTLGQVDVTVTTTDLSATSATNPSAKQDYVAVNQVVTWAPGVGGAQNVVITIIDNNGTVGQTGDAAGGIETFRINVSVTFGGATIVTALPIDVEITDD